MSKRPKASTLVTLGLVVASLVWAYGPLLVEFTANTWAYKPHYQHIPFVVLAALLLMWRGLSDPSAAGSPPGPFWAPIAAGLAWLLVIPATLIPSPILAVASLVVLIGAASCLLARVSDRRFPLGAWSLLWLVIPLPGRIDRIAIEALQRQSSWLASQALDVLAINHLMDGNALVLPDRTLFVDEACSGIVSAISIISCAAMYCVWRRRTLWHTLVVMAMAAAWAMLLNVCRIVSIALAHQQAGWDLAEGLAHTMVGLAAFGVSLMTLVASDWYALAMMAEIGPRWESLTAEPIGYGSKLVDLWDAAASPNGKQSVKQPKRERPGSVLDRTLKGGWSAATILAFLTVGGLSLTRLYDKEVTVNFPQAEAFVEALEGLELPGEFNELRLVGSGEHQRRTADSLLAEHSVHWRYIDPKGVTYLVSCDFPYVGGWHDLAVCYRGIGWQLDQTQVNELALKRPGLASFEAASIDLSRPGGERLNVVYTACFVDGTAVAAPTFTLLGDLSQGFFRRQVESRHSFQVQVYTERGDELMDSERQTSQELLEMARSRVLETAAETLGNEGHTTGELR